MNLPTRIPCPRCGSKKNKQIAGHNLQCLKCGATHAPNREGVFAVHTNPERNFEFLNERKPR